MRNLLQLICFFMVIIGCSCKPQFNIADSAPSPFVGCWRSVEQNDSIHNLSVRIGERNDSLLVAFYWERDTPYHMSYMPLRDDVGNVIPHTCINVPKSGNRVVGGIVNQYFSEFYNYPKNEYFPIAFELKSIDTLTYKIVGKTNYWPDSAVMVRSDDTVPTFSNKIVDLYKENYLVPDVNIEEGNNIDVVSITPDIFVGNWGWEKNGPWEVFDMEIGLRGDSLLLAANGVFLGGARLQVAEYDEKNRLIPQAHLFIPEQSSKAMGFFENSGIIPFYTVDTCNLGITLELFSKNTLLLKTDTSIGFWPDSAVMVRYNGKKHVFAGTD